MMAHIKMDSLKLTFIACFVGLAIGTNVHLTTKQGEAIDGHPFTLKCSVNKSLSFSKVFWKRGDDVILATMPLGLDQPLSNLKGPYGDIFGRYFVTLYGNFDHHLTLLIDRNKDEKKVWKCLAAGYESTPVTIHTRQPKPPSFWNMAWIYGLSAGITFGVLILTLPIYLRCSKSR